MRKKCLQLLLVAMLTTELTVGTKAESRWEAYYGTPFGVGRIKVGVLRGEPSLPLSDERFTVLDRDGRVMYPVLKQQQARQLLRKFLQIETPRNVTIYFLFQGDEPLEISPYGPNEQGARIQPNHDASGHRQLMEEWWEEYSNRWLKLQSDSAYPPVAENFITATLARRLGQSLSVPHSGILSRNKRTNNGLSELFCTESHQLRIDRELLEVTSNEEVELHPMPEPLQWAPIHLAAEGLDKVAVEPMATHVPEECFYLRFGTFTNYLWFRNLNKKWQGDLGNMVRRRGIQRGGDRRIEQQLSLRETMLSKVLGPQVIGDAAIIGLDPYIDQGAGIGIVFQAKNSQLLQKDLESKRREALDKFPNAEESTVQLGGSDVSLIAAPDGLVRSYYVQDGDFHLVTTSRTLAERFIEAGQGTRSLANLESFRQTRLRFPVERSDAVFAFLSERFFQNLCSPHYRIETIRRMRSVRGPLLDKLAHHMAQLEGIPVASRADLIAAGILPEGFGRRFDGSEAMIQEEGFVDSQRGVHGYFLPVADVEIEGVSAYEIAAYDQFVENFQSDIVQLPHIAAVVARSPRENGPGEQVTVELVSGSLSGVKLGWLAEMLGQPSIEQLRPIAGDVVSVESVLDIGVPLISGEKRPHHLFLGLRDYLSPLAVQQGTIMPAAARTEIVRGYLGAWPRPGLLELLVGLERPGGMEPELVDEQMWQAQQDEFLLISFKPEVIQQVLPQLAMEPAERPAQLRIRVDDLSDKLLAQSINALGYMRARETSVSASRMMNSLANQLHVPRDECRSLAEQLVDGEFVCALGGEYQLYAPERALEVWASSALPKQNRFLLTEVPEDYQLPLLEWFRGFRGDLQLTDESFSAHMEIDMTEAAVP